MNNQNSNQQEKTKKCKLCQSDIPLKATKCPHCQGDLRSWPNRHPIWTIILILILLSSVINEISDKSDSANSVSESLSNSSMFSDKNQSTATSPNPLLELISQKCETEFGWTSIIGEVKNISDKSLKNVAVVGSFYTKDGELVTSNMLLIEYNPILSGQTSPFKVSAGANPAIDSCKVNFKELLGGTIDTKDSSKK